MPVYIGDISATDIRFQNDILNRIAAGDISVFDEKVRMADIKEIRDFEACTPLAVACANGHLKIIDKLLKIDGVVENMPLIDWGILAAAYHGHLNVVERLLEIPDVIQHVAGFDNRVLKSAVSSGYLDVLGRLLSIDCIKEKKSKLKTFFFFSAPTSNNPLIAFKLAEATFPDGIRGENLCREWRRLIAQGYEEFYAARLVEQLLANGEVGRKGGGRYPRKTFGMQKVNGLVNYL